MGPDYLGWISAGYAVVSISICAIEVKRTRRSGPDVLTFFMVLFLLQCCLPGVVIFWCLRLTGLHQPTGSGPLDRIFAAMDFSSALLVLGLTAWFAIIIYVFMAFGAQITRRLLPRLTRGEWLMLRGSPTRLLIVLLFGLALTLISFWSLGNSLLDRYAALIAFRTRTGTGAADLNKLNSLAFLLTQTWLWLSVVALFVLFERRGRGMGWYFCLGCGVLFAFLSVSRRAIFIPILLAYFTFFLFDGRWRFKFLLTALIPILFWVAFGKQALAAIAFGGSIHGVVGSYQNAVVGTLQTASNLGLTLVESIGTVSLMHMSPRFGMDHLLAVMRGVPVSWGLRLLGQLHWVPERIVRLSTQTFATPNDEDIPPGLFGQMWLDFRVLGPIIWAFGFAMQLSILQWFFSLTVRTKEAVAVLAVATFVIALPLNSGTYDFSFGIDIVTLVLCVLFTFKVLRISLQVKANT